MPYPIEPDLLARAAHEGTSLFTTDERERLAVSRAGVEQFAAEIRRVQNDPAARAYRRLRPELQARFDFFAASQLTELCRVVGEYLTTRMEER